MTWDEIKKSRQKNTQNTSTRSWDEIKRSRGYTAPPAASAASAGASVSAFNNQRINAPAAAQPTVDRTATVSVQQPEEKKKGFLRTIFSPGAGQRARQINKAIISQAANPTKVDPEAVRNSDTERQVQELQQKTPGYYLFARGMEGLSNFNAGLINAARVTSKTAQEGVNKYAEEKFRKSAPVSKEDPLGDMINAAADMNQSTLRGFENVSGARKLAGDVVSSVGNMAPSLAASAFAPALGTVAFAVPAGGNYAREAELEGATPQQQLLYGVVGGTAEALMEKVFIDQLSKLLPKGLQGTLSNVVARGTNNMLRNLGRLGINFLGAAASEGLEEGVTDMVTGLAKKIIYKPEMPWTGEGGVIDPKQIGYDSLVGAVTGAAFAGPAALTNLGDMKMVKQYIDENYSPTMAVAMGLDENSKSYQMAQKLAGEEVTYEKLVNLQEQVAKDIKEGKLIKEETPVETPLPVEQPAQEVKQPVSYPAVSGRNAFDENYVDKLEGAIGRRPITKPYDKKPVYEMNADEYFTYTWDDHDMTRGVYGSDADINLKKPQNVLNQQLKAIEKKYTDRKLKYRKLQYTKSKVDYPNLGYEARKDVLAAPMTKSINAYNEKMDALMEQEKTEATEAYKKKIHQAMLQTALLSGKNVPENILEEYPYLKKKYGKMDAGGAKNEVPKTQRTASAQPGAGRGTTVAIQGEEAAGTNQVRAAQKEVAASRASADSDVSAYAPEEQAAEIGPSAGTSERSKTVDDIVQIIEKFTGVPIRTGRFRQRAYGIYKNRSRVIRTKVTNNMPVISHELGHHFDNLYGFKGSDQFDSELLELGKKTSAPGYDKDKVRAEGIAEFLRMYLTNPVMMSQKAPNFLKHFESTIDKKSLEFLNQLREDISQYANLPYNKRIYADISRGEGRKSTKNTRENVFQWVYDNWINDRGPFRRIQKLAEESGYRGRNIDLATRAYSGLEAKIRNMFTDKQLNINNQVIGPSLGEILEPINVKKIKKRGGDPVQEHQDFLSYLVSRRAVDYENRNLHMPQPFYVYKSNVTAMERKYPHFKLVFDGLRLWEDNNFDLLVDSGIMTEKDAEEIRKNNPNHMPLHRIMEAVETHKAGAGKTLGQSKKVVKRATGSGKTIIDPLESIIADTFIIRRAAEANLLLQDMKKAVESIEGFGDVMEFLPPGMRMTQFKVEDIKKQLKDMAEKAQNQDLLNVLENMPDDQLETSLKVFRPLMSERNGEITIYEKGKAHLYQVDPELYRAIKGLNRQASHFIIRLLNIPKKIIQAGAVTTVDFMMRNMVRDTFTSLIQSEAGITPIDIFKGYVSAMKKDEHFQNFIRHGGGTEVFNMNSRQDAQLVEDDLLGYDIGTMVQRAFADIKEMKANNNERTRNKAWNSMKALLGLPFRSIRDAVGWSELGPRVAEYRKAREKKVNAETAAAWGRELSVDFMQAGTLGREYNKITAFFNAWVQGNTRIVESFKKHPYRTILRGLLYVTLPTLANYFINNSDDERKKAYEQLPEWRKAAAWNIWIGNGRFFPLPKPPGYAWIFGGVPEVFLDKLLKKNPGAWKNLLEQFASNFGVDVVPSALSPLAEVAANKSWTGAPIESAADGQEFPYLRYNANTSTLAKALSDLSKDVKGGISPKKVDYLIRAYTGTVGDFLWRLPDAGKNTAIDPGDVTQYPVVKKFVVDTAYSNQSMDRFFSTGEEITRYINEMEKGIPRAVKHLDNAELAEAVSLMEQYQEAYNALSKQFSEGRKAIRELEGIDLPVQKKKDSERAIRQGMNSAAYRFYESYLEFKKKYKLR